MAPATQTALVIQRRSTEHELPLAVSDSVPVPGLASPYHVLVRVLAVALNPNDHKMMLHFPTDGNTGGCDFCGVVDVAGELSSHTTGTRVCGAAFPYKPGDTGGSFAQYLAVDSRLLVQVPTSWTDLQGAAFGGVGWSTLSMAFSDLDALALSGSPSKPIENKQPVLVYGGATATGTLACQLLKLSGYHPVAVASAASAPLAAEYGAGGVASYNTPSRPCLDQIRSITQGAPIRYVLDCITDAESAATCFQAIARTGGSYACLEQFHEGWHTRRAVKVKEVMGFEVLGVDVDLGPNTTYTRMASSRLHEVGITWASEMQRLVQAGLLKPHPLAEVKATSGQWSDAVLEGLRRLRRGELQDACDRCRKSKLRCPPRDDASQACDRCLSLGLLCSTTPQVGRRSDGPASQARNMSTTIRPSPPIENGVSMSFLNPGSIFPVDAPAPNATSTSHDWPGAAPHNNQGMSISLSDDPFNMLSILPPGSYSSPSIDGGDSVWCNPMNFAWATRADSKSGPSSSQNKCPDHVSVIECSTYLSRLRMQLSHSLQQSMEDTAGFWNGDLDATEQQNTGRNPFGEALCRTSEFLTIIQSLMQQPREAHGETNPLPSPSVFGTMDLVITVDILSAYTQILSIYDGLFQQLYTTLRSTMGQEASDLSMPRLQTLPGLQLAGFSVLQSNLQTKILMQAIMHQFETLEKVLALPRELRVSKRVEVYPGGLLGRDPRTQEIVDGFLAAGAQYLEGHVNSLRANMVKLGVILDI
ncbi:hypothetical protein F5B20DRAFT_579273 [Whalleya microplaca]|nr:hypothetical protein F5B20DRAFT_579273 [Whalleya microplaca]